MGFFWCGSVELKKPHTLTVVILIVKMIVMAVIVTIIVSLDQGDDNICPALDSKAVCCVHGFRDREGLGFGVF